MENNFLLNTIPFKNFSEKELEDALEFFKSYTKEYSNDEYIFSCGDLINEFGIIIKGNLIIENTDFLGNQIIIAKLSKGSIFAETYAYLENQPLMVDVKTQGNTEVLFLNINMLKSYKAFSKKWILKFTYNLLNVTAKKNINLSNRIFHTSSKKARFRISSYLSSQAIIKNNLTFEIPFNRQQMADYLNLDRSALSKELSKMKKENLIDYKKNKFILNPNHFEI